MDLLTANRLVELADRLESAANRLTIDGDAHITDLDRYKELPAADRRVERDGYYHGRPICVEELLAEMSISGIDMTLVWQNPAATMYGSDPDRNAETLLAANQYVHLSAQRYPQAFIPAGWVDPKHCGLANALAMVETLVREFGFPVVKMNPAQNAYPIDSPEVAAVVDRIVELGAAPAFHVGADSPFTPAEGLMQVITRHPSHPFIAVHMGGGGAGYLAAEQLYHDLRALGLKHPNLTYVFSAMRETYIEEALISYQLAGEPFCYNLFCGSDAPYGRQSWNFGGYRAMFETLMDAERHPSERIRKHPGLFTPQIAQNYLGGNLARFIAARCRRLLQIHVGDAARCS